MSAHELALPGCGPDLTLRVAPSPPDRSVAGEFDPHGAPRTPWPRTDLEGSEIPATSCLQMGWMSDSADGDVQPGQCPSDRCRLRRLGPGLRHDACRHPSRPGGNADSVIRNRRSRALLSRRHGRQHGRGGALLPPRRSARADQGAQQYRQPDFAHLRRDRKRHHLRIGISNHLARHSDRYQG